ncbi:hypothetical protein [Helicobacter anseris]|nr:hypothetical protein [Helicobacter anseris]
MSEKKNLKEDILNKEIEKIADFLEAIYKKQSNSLEKRVGFKIWNYT